MNWGGFAGGFAQGFNQTFDSKGLTRYMLSPEYRQAKIMEQANAEAKAAEGAPTMVDTAKSGGISGQQESVQPAAPAPAAEVPKVDATATPSVAPEPTTTPMQDAPTATPGSGIKAVVADQQTSATPQASQAPAEQPVTQQAMAQTAGIAGQQPQQAKPATKSPAAVEDFLYSKVLPIARNKFVEAGDLDAADRLDKQMESAKGKAAISLYGKAYNALTYGNDVNKAVQLFGEYYNRFVDDGVDFTKGEITKDGQIAITTKNKADGKEGSLTMSRGQLLRMGMAYNPVELFKMNLTEAQEAEKAGAKNRADIAKEDRQFNRDIEKMTIKDQLDAANVGAKERRAMNTKIEALRAAGYSEDFINRSMPAILGIGDKKATSPDEARRLAYADRLKSDHMFGRKSKEERDRIISEDMGIVFAGGKPSDMPAAPAPATTAAAGLPKAGKGIPVFDTKTNTIIYK